MNTQLLGSGRQGMHTKFWKEKVIWKTKNKWEVDRAAACPMVGWVLVALTLQISLTKLVT
jgi:hypothetical protein